MLTCSVNHRYTPGDFYDPSIGEKFASLPDLVSYFYKNPNELKEKNGDWIHLKYPLNFDEPTEVIEAAFFVVVSINSHVFSHRQ